jgi:malate dehydrogenase
MRRKIVVAGTGDLAEEVVERLTAPDLLDVLETGDGWADAAGADVVVVVAGDAADTARQAAVRCPDAVLVVAQEPVEAVCRDALEASRMPRARVVGIAGAVESARLRAAVAEALGISAHDVSALVLGGRGGAAVPVLSAVRVAGAPVTDKLAAERVADVIAGLRAGPPADHREVAAAVIEAVEAIAFDRRRVMSCAVLCIGELGIERAVVGVPVVLGDGGVERILDVVLDDHEREALAASSVPLD